MQYVIPEATCIISSRLSMEEIFKNFQRHGIIITGAAIICGHIGSCTAEQLIDMVAKHTAHRDL